MQNPKQYSPLALAFLGDAVFELMVREKTVRESNLPVKKLHDITVSYVCAESQAIAMKELVPLLTAEEFAIFRRGRNASGAVPKNADVRSYRIATGLEALFGYLYLMGDTDRIQELFERIDGHN
ncbi:MAG: ribonuclease III [Oscillospiraceae bacterium]|nr:ribonuclease III [Oscillospiraceae bacterium]